MKILGSVLVAVLILMSTAAAEPAWLCQNFPKWKMCLPKTQASQPAPVPVPAPQSRAKPEAAPAKPVESAPAPPKVQPRSVERRPAAKPKPKPRVEQRSQEPLSGGGQRSPARPQADGGFCFFPISCATVCSYARAGDNRRGTECQNARGLACVRSTCPDVLRKRQG